MTDAQVNTEFMRWLALTGSRVLSHCHATLRISLNTVTRERDELKEKLMLKETERYKLEVDLNAAKADLRIMTSDRFRYSEQARKLAKQLAKRKRKGATKHKAKRQAKKGGKR